MRKIQAGPICRDNRGVSDFAGRNRDTHGTFRGHLFATVAGGGNVCCKAKSLPPVARSTGARNWAPLGDGDAERHPRRDYTMRSFRYVRAWCVAQEKNPAPGTSGTPGTPGRNEYRIKGKKREQGSSERGRPRGKRVENWPARNPVDKATVETTTAKRSGVERRGAQRGWWRTHA